MHVQDKRHSVTTCQRFRLVPDLVLDLPDRTVIFDTKWKSLDPDDNKLGVASSDVYQMLAYGHAYQRSGKTIELVLLYPAQPSFAGHLASWSIRGSQIPLDIVALDVSDPQSVTSILRKAVSGGSK